MRRLWLVGNSGSGKSTLGRALADRMGVPYLELDSVFHQPGWVPLPRDELHARVAEATAGDDWVVDGNYGGIRDLLVDRADTVVWLDLPRSVVMRQVVRRTLRRVITGEELWNGNRETWKAVLSRDPTRSIILWSWTNHHRYRDRYLKEMTNPAWAHLRFVRLRTRGEAAALLANVSSASGG